MITLTLEVKWKQYESTLGVKNEIIKYYSLLNEMDGMCVLPKWINKWIIVSLGIKMKRLCYSLPPTLGMKMKRLCYSLPPTLCEWKTKWLYVWCYLLSLRLSEWKWNDCMYCVTHSLLRLSRNEMKRLYVLCYSLGRDIKRYE